MNRPQIREASLIKDKFGLKKDSYILFLGRLVPEKGIRYLVEAFKNVKTDKKLVIAGGSSDTDSFIDQCKRFKTDYYHATPKQREFIDAVATHEYQLMKAHEKGLSRASVPPFMGMKRSERSNNMPA